MQNFVDRIIELSQKHPDKTALVWKEKTLSYAQLERLSARIASRLLRNGAEKEKIYPILLERGFLYIASMIGILRAGAAFSPLSLEYPEERVTFILKDCKGDFAVDESFLRNIEEETILSEFPEIRMEDAAIAIYTSGSTGNPKGILHDHWSFTNTLVRQLSVGASFDDVEMSVTPFNFAISSHDILTSLWAGAEIHILTEEQRKDILFIDQYIDSHHITAAVISPQLLKRLPVRESSLKLINSGGERISGIYSPYAHIKNAYGLSELLSIAMSFELDKEYDNTPIGKPLEGYKALLLDEDGNLVPDGEEGELCIAGTMARGYINLPKKTAETFTENPYSEDETDKRLLHTNDICKRLPDGNIVYVNRKDWMVKINGQRVEMGEIEIQLGKIEGIQTAVVKAFTDPNGQTYVCGYYKAERELKDAEIRSELSRKFPSYMIPRFLVQVDTFPLTPNGKLDRNALKEPKGDDFKSTYAAPETEAEKAVCAAFEKLLEVEKVGVNDDFFSLGGDSIKVVMLQEELEEYHLSSSQIFSLRTPKAIAGSVGKEEAVLFEQEKKDFYPMTEPQLGIYLANMQDIDSLEYNNPASLFFPKEIGIDAEKLKDAVKETVNLYPSLKVCVKVKDGVPGLVPVLDLPVEIPLKKTAETDAEVLCRQFLDVFDFERGPLFRFCIYETPEGLYLFQDVHHLITDGTSTSRFLQNLAKLYEKKAPDPETVTSFQLSSYEEKQKNSPKYEACREFYRDMLESVELDSGLIPDEMDEVPEKNGGHMVYSLGQHLPAARVEEIARKYKVTENTLFLGAFAYALAVESGQDAALFCTVENGRHIPEIKNTYGMLVRTLPIYLPAEAEQTCESYLGAVQDRLFACLDHDLVSIVQLANEYDVNSDILFVYQGEMLNGIEIEGHFVPYRMHKSGDAMSRLSLDVLKQEGDYLLSFEYRADLYREETIENFAGLYINIIRGMLECESLKEITFCGEKEKAFYRMANENQVPFDRSLSYVDLFREQVKRHPDRIAIGFKEKTLTYGELDHYSENLAKRLSTLGVHREVPVGILVPRSELFPVCTLGILKAGGCCQPLDGNYPEERLSYMLEDSGAPVVIADDALVSAISGYQGTIFSADEVYHLQEEAGVTPEGPAADSLFALIYTSGSTGKPKGCMLEHKNLVNFSLSFCRKFHITEEDHFAAFGAFGFDASMQDLYPALSAGASVYIVPEETRLDLPALHQFVLDNRITMMDCTTQLGRQYVTAYPESPYMKVFTVGGEKLVPLTPPGFDFVNTYGPTECTIYVTDYLVDKQYLSVPIGKTFGNCDAYIVDKQRRLLPPGAVGELVISGLPVARGYLNRPDLTEKAFLPNPFFTMEGYEKMYLTGDICRYLPDGNIQFVGRRDEQVKIRGFRIELTEIERRIREYEPVKDACVITKELPDGGKAVVAYVVSDEKVDARALGRFIAEELPSYMVPQVIMQIDAISLTPNGKVDKRKLPEPVIESSGEENVRELNRLEQELLEMVNGITGFSSRSVSESLLSMGLTSLTTILFSAKLFERFGLEMKATDLMEDDCTLLSVENRILEKMLFETNGAETVQEEAEIENIPLSAEQLGVYYDSMKRPDALVYNIPMRYILSKQTDVQKLRTFLMKLIEASPILSAVVDLAGKDLVLRQMKDFDPDVPVRRLKEQERKEVEAGFVRPFNLAHGPLFRAEILLTETNVILLVDAHHIIFDGLSLSALIRRLSDIYKNMIEPQTDVSFFTYIMEKAALEKGVEGKQALSYYRSLFADYENASDIAADLQGREEEGELREAISFVGKEEVEAFCRENKLTPAALFLAATEYAVSRFTSDRHVYMSMISGGREDVRFFDSFGMFVKTLPLHGVVDTERTALQFVSDTFDAMHAAQKNSAYPFLKLIGQYGFISRINYACQLGLEEHVEIEGCTVIEEGIVKPLPKFHLSVHIEEGRSQTVAVNVQYNSALYTEETARRFSSAIAQAAKEIIKDASQKLCGIRVLTEEEQKQVEQFAGFEEREVPIRLYHELFEAQAKEHPEKTALIAVDATFTYQELDRAANRLANALLQKGVRKGDRVAFLLPRTSRQIIAMYGILKTGAAYIPCDPEYPEERIRYILENSEARWILSDGTHGFERELDVEALLQNENTEKPEADIRPEDMAYLIYTSGSTGKPKGVIINHGAIANYLTPYKENTHIDTLKREGHIYVSVTTVSFDMSLKETAAALCNGLTLVLADEEEARDPGKLCALFRKTGGDVFNATPSRLEQYLLLDEFKEVISKCAVILCGGEKYSPKLLKQLQGITKARLFNTYGPTEITVSCNAKELTHAGEVCVGRPLLNMREYIVDPDGNLLPPGCVGELYVGGAGVADGYLNNPEMTEKSFAVWNGERIYKTGDYARWTETGDVEILGRSDHQVKLRGLRIELGEVERAILAVEGVQQAVAMIRKINGADHLCAWYSAAASVTEKTVRNRISEQLTAYMVPTALMRLDAMPQTPNGKIDVKALPEPAPGAQETYREPVTDEEKVFCEIFEEVLSLDKVSCDASFFDLGGTSLTATSVMVAANDRGFEVSYGDIFTLKTPRALATKCAGAETGANDLSGYDYSVFDEILQGNTLEALEGKKERIGNLLLTGVTGFLGIHILKEFLDRYSGVVYCLQHPSKKTPAEQRLRTQFFYYFEDDYAKVFEKRLKIIEGGVDETGWFDSLSGAKIDTVINCAALVKHFSETDDIERVNAEGVKNLLAFCKEHGSMMIQISTGSVAGDRVNNVPPQEEILTEQKFYFGQTIDNQYVHSKFLAERYVLEAIREGVRAKIMRVGNLSARAEDGEFQLNFVTNGFMGRLRAYLAIGGFPYSMMNFPVEMAPIDETAKAILTLCHTPDACCIFHPFNNHYVPLGDIILEMQKVGIPIRLVEDDEFLSLLQRAEKDPAKAHLLTTLLAYDNKDSTKTVEMIRADEEYTTQTLYRNGFYWSMTSRSYMNRFLKALHGLGFFDVGDPEE